MGARPKKQTYERVRLDSARQIRLMIVMAVLGVGALLLVIWRLYSLMIQDYDYYAGLALRNQTRSTTYIFFSPR